MDFDKLYAILALLLAFWGVLWTLGTRDRKKIIFLLKLLQEMLQSEENGDGKNTRERR